MAKIRFEELSRLAGEVLPERTVLSALWGRYDGLHLAGQPQTCTVGERITSPSGDVLTLSGPKCVKGFVIGSR